MPEAIKGFVFPAVIAKYTRTRVGLSSKVVVETLESITNEWQAHFWCVFSRWPTGSCCGSSGSFQVGGVISLVNLIGWEICRIDIGSKFGLEWRTYTAKSIEFNATEEFVILNLICTTTTETILGITNKTVHG